MMGVSGFAIGKVRFELSFHYTLLAPHVRPGKLTRLAWGYVIRLCHHLYLTADLPLVIAPGPNPFGGRGSGVSYTVVVDSSHGNGPHGRSIGGWAIFFGNGGACVVKSVCQRKVTDSSGGQELNLATQALKAVLGINMLLDDLRLGGIPIPESEPVRFLVDATAVIDGVANEQIKRATRWLAARKAMLRAATEANVITIEKVDALDNVADILTKPLTGAAFARHRATLLGLHLLSAETVAAFSPALKTIIFGPWDGA